jgi:hypothetical protein
MDRKQTKVKKKKRLKQYSPLDLSRQFSYKDDAGRRIWYWRDNHGEFHRISTMVVRHLQNVREFLEKNNFKFSRWWYIVDQELRRRGIALTKGGVKCHEHDQ